MFGFLRTVFALMVMLYHTYLGFLQLGTYAVFGFFIISGYLMTHIMHNTYGFNTKGRLSFVANRFLRLHPMYWAAACISIALVLVLGIDQMHHFHKSMFLPKSTNQILENIFMVFPAWIPGSIHPRLVPPTWAITVEMFYYALICFGISKTLVRVKVWIGLSLCFLAYTFFYDLPWRIRYFHILAASLPFSIGALIYYIKRDSLCKNILTKMQLNSSILFVLMLLNCFVWISIPKNSIGQYIEIGFYLNLIISALLVISIIQGGKIINISSKLDKFIGDYSYPIYLLHLPAGLIASVIIFKQSVGFHRFTYNSSINFILALFIVIGISTAFIYLLDKPIQKLRLKIKNKLSLPVGRNQ